MGDREVVELANEIFEAFEFGVGGVNSHLNAPVDHPVLTKIEGMLSTKPTDEALAMTDLARRQLGTIGSGNHYVDLLTDNEGYVWVGVHFGSRGFGYKIADFYKQMQDHNGLIQLDTPGGGDYWSWMSVAGEYAYAGRDWVVDTTLAILGAKQTDRVHNHHNFAWSEKHFGEHYIVVRKGATPARPGQRGFVGGSMGDISVILAGSGENTDHQKAALYSTVHGAGRVMSRTAARQNVTQADMKDWIDRKGVILRGGGLDESPQAYRRLPDVLDAQGDTIDVLYELEPFVVCMASDRGGRRKRKKKKKNA